MKTPADVDAPMTIEVTFWIAFFVISFHNQNFYWAVTFLTFITIRLSFLALVTWACMPPRPWFTLGGVIVAIASLLSWMAFVALSLYGLFLTPIHIIFSPMELWTRYSANQKPLRSLNYLHEPEDAVVE